MARAGMQLDGENIMQRILLIAGMGVLLAIPAHAQITTGSEPTLPSIVAFDSRRAPPG